MADKTRTLGDDRAEKEALARELAERDFQRRQQAEQEEQQRQERASGQQQQQSSSTKKS